MNDCVEEDDEHDRNESILFEEDGDESDGSDTIDDCEGIEGNWNYQPQERDSSLLALIEVDDSLEQGEEGEEEADHLNKSPVPSDWSVFLLKLQSLFLIRSGEEMNPLG